MPGKGQTSVVKEKESKKLDMKIEIKDFGPISSGKITLKPLTVFIGPNNSGKSYAARLINSIFGAYTLPRALSFTPRWISGISEMKKRLDGLREGEEFHLSKQLTEELTEKGLEELYQEKLSDEIIRSFACPLREMIRMGKDLFLLNIAHGNCNINLMCHEDSLTMTEHPQLDVSFVVRLTRSQKNVPVYKFGVSVGQDRRFSVETEQSLWIKDTETVLSMLMRSVSWLFCSKVVGDAEVKCYYLPAERSGIIQVYKTLAASIIRQIPLVSKDISDVMNLPLGTADLLSSLVDLPEDKTPLYELVRGFEEELIEGEIPHPFSDRHFAAIRYATHGTEISLHRSSSGVSELAPLFLYLKYIIKPNNTLVMDEPEAHLHPRNQRILARLLVRLVREGVNIVITTHSEYLLEQLRNFILLSKVEPEKRLEKYEYSEEDYLKPDEFAAYLFHYDKKSKGHKIDRVKMTKDGEFSQDEFVNVIDALYEETIRLRIDLSDET